MGLRETEAMSIRIFVEDAARDGYLSGRVLDYGCGNQPYREIVEEAGGEYVGYDRADFPANVSGVDVGSEMDYSTYQDKDAILCNQVVQYVPMEKLVGLAAPEGMRSQNAINGLFWLFNCWLKPGGHLVLTYPTNWPEVEPDDLHRFTNAGMERMLTDVGFKIVRHDFRHGFSYQGVSFTVGYGVVAQT